MYDGRIVFKNRWKQFLTRTGLEVGTAVLITFKTSARDELEMIVVLNTL